MDGMDDSAQSTNDNPHIQALAPKVDIPSSSISALIDEIRLLRKENRALHDSFKKAFKMDNPVETPPSLSTTISDEKFACYLSIENWEITPVRPPVRLLIREGDFQLGQEPCIALLVMERVQLYEEQPNIQSLGFRERVLSAWPEYIERDPYAVLSTGPTNRCLIHTCSITDHDTEDNVEGTTFQGRIWLAILPSLPLSVLKALENPVDVYGCI